MGQYLQCGIAKKIIIESRYNEDNETILESYNGLFTYLRNCIINSLNNPIRTSVIITIYG